MKEKLLITGGTGFVGYHIIEEAVKQGFEVYVATRKSSLIDHLKEFNLQYTAIDFSDINAIRKELEAKQYNYIIHAAGTTKAANQEEYNLVNARYAFNLAQAASIAAIPLKKIVFVSSLAALGPCNDGESITEYSVPNPVTGYGRSKLDAEKMLNGIKGLPLITFRPTAVYGPRDKDIFIVIKAFCKGLEPYIGNKPQQLSFVYVKDLAKLFVDSLRSDIIGKSYNVSDGKTYDRFQFATFTKEIIKRKTLKFHVPVGMVRVIAGILEAAGAINKKTPALNREKIKELTATWMCSIEAVTKDLNFVPKYDLKAGLGETLKWYKDNKWI